MTDDIHTTFRGRAADDSPSQAGDPPTLPMTARIYLTAVTAVGAIVLASQVQGASITRPGLFLVLLALSCTASIFKVELPLKGKLPSTLSMSHAVDLAALVLLGPQITTFIAAASAWSQCTFNLKHTIPLRRTLFSMAVLAITVRVAGLVYLRLGGEVGSFALTWSGFGLPLAAAASTYLLVNALLVGTAVALSNGQPLLSMWNENVLWGAPSFAVGAVVATATVWFINQSGQWFVWIAALPIYVTYRTYSVYLRRIAKEREQVERISDLHLATIEALALAIEAKDHATQSHVRRLPVFAAALARAMGMAELDIQGVKTAALLHDIGKLAVPEHILSKPGPLTSEEFQKVRIHPQVGADIISAVPFPYPVAPLILGHHERWDGTGYPSGLRGEEIPLGARILTVVDYYDALVSERPFHRPMNSEAALSVLRQESGKALDPTAVRTFLSLLPELNAETERSMPAARRVATPAYAVPARIAPGVARLTRTQSVFEDIALAHREIYALYEIAQTMGTSLGVADTMGLISSKLTNLVPFSCCALYLHVDEANTLRCRFAAGIDAEVIARLSMPNGQGLAGWVAQSKKSIVNGRPTSDLEAAGMEEPIALQSALECPLLFNDRVIGTLAVYHVDPGFYTEDHCRLLERVCEQAAAVISNSIVFEQTQEDSLTDSLTGLPNTRFMFMHLTRELARAERLSTDVGLLVMDLDHFKQVNDRHGHHIGDRALRQVAGVLRAAIRPYDVCVRYAGDEFIVILPGCDPEDVEIKRQELQSAIEDLPLEIRPGRTMRLGMSVGGAVFPQDGATYEALLAVADSRMYRDKADRKQRGDMSSADLVTPVD